MQSVLVMFVLFVMLSAVCIIPTAYAEEDDDDYDDDDREGYGEMKREREHQDEGIPLGTTWTMLFCMALLQQL